MDSASLHRLPLRDPVSGGDLYVSELTNDESGVTIRGRFAIPAYARLDEDQNRFLETFLRCRGTFNAVERELGISYPTVKARLESLVQALGLSILEPKPSNDKFDDRRSRILEQLEKGEITADEAKQRLRVAG